MTRRIIITATTLVSLVVGVLVAATGTASAATTRTVTGKLVGTQLAGWTYQVEYYAYDDTFNSVRDRVTVSPSGSYSFQLTGFTHVPTVDVQYLATQGDTEATGFGYKSPNSSFAKQVTFDADQTSRTLDDQSFTTISGQVYAQDKGTGSGGLSGVFVRAFGSPLTAHEDATYTGGRTAVVSGAGGAFTFPIVYAGDTTKFKVGTSGTSGYLGGFNGGVGTYAGASSFSSTPTAARTGVALPLVKPAVIKGKVALPSGATRTDRSVALWSATDTVVGLTTATAQGGYTFGSLRPGTYRVSFGRVGALASGGKYAKTTVSKLPPSFYKNLGEPAGLGKAVPITVTAGATKTLSTQTVKASSGGAVSGTITFKYAGKYRGPSAGNGDFASIYVSDPKGRLSSRSDELDSKGRWKVTGLAPGTFTVYAYAAYKNPKTGAVTTYRYKKIGTVTVTAGRTKAFGTRKY